ncbi:MAG TPA: TetR/AcrR family transcriptional regulator [Magnetospirillaceae bacterium]|jgi:AcrR family transcriptional regulator
MVDPTERSSSEMPGDYDNAHEAAHPPRFTAPQPAEDDDGLSHAAVPAWRQRRRNRILAAATELFATRPYPLVSMDEVADTARMGKATLYRYFPSKEDLYVAVFDLVLDELNGLLDVAAAEGGTCSEILRRMIGILVPALGEHFRGLRTIDDGVMHAAERKRRLFRSRRHLITGHIEEAIIAGIERGEFRGVRAATCAQMIIGMIWSLSTNSSDTPEIAAQAVSDLFLNGALAAPQK